MLPLSPPPPPLPQVHWFSIGNSVLVVLVMATIVATIMIRTVHRDLAKYEALVSDGGSVDIKDEAGWKLVSGDVFRSPAASKMLAVQVGVGVEGHRLKGGRRGKAAYMGLWQRRLPKGGRRGGGQGRGNGICHTPELQPLSGALQVCFQSKTPALQVGGMG